MNREEFIKYQEERIAELFPPERRRKVAESAKEMLDDACSEMEREYGKDWRDKAKADYDPKTAFLTELQALMKRYNVTIDVDGDECALWLTIDIGGHAIEYVAYDFYTGKEKQTALTPDNIFNYEKG